jgi:short-subunit dehydrogenase
MSNRRLFLIGLPTNLERGSAMSERRFVITGAASGIGRAVAEIAATRGAALSLVDVDDKGLDAVAAGLRSNGTRVSTIHADPRLPTSRRGSSMSRPTSSAGSTSW